MDKERYQIKKGDISGKMSTEKLKFRAFLTFIAYIY